MDKKQNPFITSGYRGAKYFCDRKSETDSILQNTLNGQSTTLIAIRRIGKTGLIKHVINKLPSNYVGVYVDILPTENMDEFLNTLTSAIFNAIPEKTPPGKRIIEFIKALRPVITYDPLSGIPQVSVDVRKGESVKHIDTIFGALETFPKKVVIAIDEFQQILQYPEKNTDAWLRSRIHTLNNVVFIFSGSQQHLMSELFSDPSRPFYRSTSLLHLGKIDSEKYSTFIARNFTNGGMKIKKEIIAAILDWTDNHTYYVQLLCNRLYAIGSEEITDSVWKMEASRLLEEQEMIFYKYRDLLTIPQWQFLKAIAKEGKTYAPTSKEFIAKYSLGSPATVLRSLHALQKREMIYSDYDKESKSFLKVYDILFHRWMESQTS